jgi:hypothetical protein
MQKRRRHTGVADMRHDDCRQTYHHTPGIMSNGLDRLSRAADRAHPGDEGEPQPAGSINPKSHRAGDARETILD